VKYFVAHLLSGEAKAYHERLTRALAARYRIFPLHEKVSPHITVKPPFETDEEGIKEVERVLRACAHSEHAVSLSIKGFGHFGFRTIYLDTQKNPDATALVRRVIRALNENISWMPKYPHEGNKLHASVARFMDRVQYRRVARYVAKETADFKIPFDNVAILKKEGKVWEVVSIIPFVHEENAWLSSQYPLMRKGVSEARKG
jgi:2'-5' RNA ligase